MKYELNLTFVIVHVILVETTDNLRRCFLFPVILLVILSSKYYSLDLITLTRIFRTQFSGINIDIYTLVEVEKKTEHKDLLDHNVSYS